MSAPSSKQSIRKAMLFVFVVGLTALHFATGVSEGREHLLHVGLRVGYFVPLILGALWFGFRGGVAVATTCSALLLLHAGTSWAAHPMENVNQVAMALLFPVVGTIAGLLVEREDAERRARIASKRREERRIVIQCIASLAEALAAKDSETRAHSEQVAGLAAEIAVELGLSEESLELVRLAGLAHDIGKIGLRDDILLKPGPVAGPEEEQIRRHPQIAADILRPIAGAGEVAEIVLSHHEHLDGSGYPRGLTARELSTEARVVTIADIYSAMTQNRPYRSALSSGEAFSLLSELAREGKLDSEAVAALGQVLNRRAATAQPPKQERVPSAWTN